ncbi:MAG: hypothetical protein IAX21_00240 [Candidatus Bathyarchaeota archaeon]|nr:MAG: hypothetical protein IAX21_00240 [Candidatus Bathyarchaeota archaeon]
MIKNNCGSAMVLGLIATILAVIFGGWLVIAVFQTLGQLGYLILIIVGAMALVLFILLARR